MSFSVWTFLWLFGLSCTRATAPVCPVGSVLCGSTLCIPHSVLPRLATTFTMCGDHCLYSTDTCNGTCTEGHINCQGKCLSDQSHWRCGDTCIHKSEPCQGLCPDNLYNCGAKCRELENSPYWALCGDTCVFRDEPCNGRCPPDMFLCGGKCETRALLEQFHWRGCGGECVPPTTDCNGICVLGYQPVGGGGCVETEPWPG